MEESQQEYYNAVQAANRLKSMGNDRFKQKDCMPAIEAYTQGIEKLRTIPHIDEPGRDPSLEELASVLYANRAAAHLALENDPGAKYRLVAMLGCGDQVIAESVWSSEILRSLDKAEQDAASSVKYNPKNAKAHYRLGLARLELVLRDPDLDERREKAAKSIESLQQSQELGPTAMTKQKLDLAKKTIADMDAHANVKPFAANA